MRKYLRLLRFLRQGRGGGGGGGGGAGGDGGDAAPTVAGGWSAGILHNSANGTTINDSGASIVAGLPGAGGASPGDPGANGGAFTIEPVSFDLPGLAPIPLPLTSHARGMTEPGLMFEISYAHSDTTCVTQSITLASPPELGTAQFVGTQIFYTPDPVFTGEVTFQYNVFDLNGLCALGVAHVTIRDPGADPCAEPCTGDINGDGVVDTADLGVLIGQFGSMCGP